MKHFKTLAILFIFNLCCFLVLKFKFYNYTTESLITLKSWHPSFGGFIYYYTHYIIYFQYLLSLLILFYFIFKSLKFQNIFSFIKNKKSIIILTFLLLFSVSTSFFNTNKFYPSIRFPDFNNPVKEAYFSQLLKVNILDNQGEKINLRKAMQPYEIHQYTYVMLNIMFQERKANTLSFLEKHILKEPVTVKFDTTIYHIPK